MYDIKTLTIALVAALALAPGPARSEEAAAPKKPDSPTETRHEREIAADAIRTAAEEAARSVVRETRLDLDIRLVGPTSPRIAGTR